MVTEQNIERARQALDAANTNLAAEQESCAGDWNNPRLTMAQQWQRTAQADLDRLETERAAERGAVERQAQEKAAAPLVKQAGKDLAASAERVRRAVEAAQAALVELVDAAGARDALVVQTAGELAARGLKLGDGAEHQTGGRVRGSIGGGSAMVRLAGAWHLGVDPAGLLAWLVARVQTARMGLPRPVGARLHEGRADGLLDGVAAVPAVEVARLRVRVGEVPPRSALAKARRS